MAESFGVDAERYDRARLRYPAGLIERLAAGGPRVLDVGSGTGIAARQLRAAGCEVLGVDPDARMAELARRLGVETEVSTFEDWGPAGRRFDVVAAAQAWHWVDPVAGAAKVAEVLNPGGRFAAFWNVFRLPPAIAGAFATVFAEVMPEAPIDRQVTADPVEAYRVFTGKAAAGLRETGAFAEPEEWTFEWEWTYTRETFLDQLPTSGILTRLPTDRLAGVLDGVGAAVDELGGTFAVPYTTIALTALAAGR